MSIVRELDVLRKTNKFIANLVDEDIQTNSIDYVYELMFKQTG